MIRWLKSYNPIEYLSNVGLVDSDIYQSESNRPYTSMAYEPWSATGPSVELTYDNPTTNPKNIRYNREGDVDYDKDVKWQEMKDLPSKGTEYEPAWYRTPKNVNDYKRTKLLHRLVGPYKKSRNKRKWLK